MGKDLIEAFLKTGEVPPQAGQTSAVDKEGLTKLFKEAEQNINPPEPYEPVQAAEATRSLREQFSEDATSQAKPFKLDRYIVTFKDKAAFNDFHRAYDEFMTGGDFRNIWMLSNLRKLSPKDAPKTEAELNRIVENFEEKTALKHETAAAMFIHGHMFSKFGPEYVMGAVMRESSFDPTRRPPGNDDAKLEHKVFGPFQIKAAYMIDAVGKGKIANPNNIFGDFITQIKERLDAGKPLTEENLKTAEDPLWAAALKEAYFQFYKNHYDLPDDLRSAYLLHLGTGNAQNIAGALKRDHDPKNPEQTHKDSPMDDVIAPKVVNHQGNKALFKNTDGTVKTVKQFWEGLEDLGIPAGRIPDKPQWKDDHVKISVAKPGDNTTTLPMPPEIKRLVDLSTHRNIPPAPEPSPFRDS